MKRKALGLCLMGMLLVGCNFGGPPPVQPSVKPAPIKPTPIQSSKPKRFLGSFEVNFDAEQGGRNTLISARASQVDSEIGFERQSFTDFESGGVRYLYATFKVTNFTQNLLNNLTFHAYEQSGQTVGGTALKNLLNFGGSGLSSADIARTLIPTHAAQLSGINVVLKTDAADFQVFTPTEIALVQSGAVGVDSLVSADRVLEYGYGVRKPTGDAAVPFLKSLDGVGCTDPDILGFKCNEGTVTIGYRFPNSLSSATPYRFTAMFTVTDQADNRVTRSLEPLETIQEAQTRADSLGATVVQVGPDDGDPATLELSNAVISSAPGYLLEPQCGPVGADQKTTFQVQGNSSTSPIVTQLVTVDGVVTGDFQNVGSTVNLDGFFIQDRYGDGDNTTSDGIFVYAPGSTVNVKPGDYVRVTGTVAEFDGTSSSGRSVTQITPVSNIQFCSPGGLLSSAPAPSDPPTRVSSSGGPGFPAPVTLAFPLASGQNDLERYEGMRVQVPGQLSVTEHFQLGRFGQVVLSSGGTSNQSDTDGRLDQYTQFNAPSVSGYASYQTELSKRRIVLDDGRIVQNPEPILLGRQGNPLSATNTLRGGDSVTGLEGILSEGCNSPTCGNTDPTGAPQYRIQPTRAVNFVGVNARINSISRQAALRVSSFNVLNFFNVLDTISSTSSAPTFTPQATNSSGARCPAIEVRGAEDYVNVTTDSQGRNEFARQRAKIVAAIRSLDADVLGLIEIQNNGSDSSSAIVNLVAALNRGQSTNNQYSVVSDPAEPEGAGCDAIKVAFIYKSSAVIPVLGTGQSATNTPVTVLNDPALSNDPTVLGSLNGDTVTVSSGVGSNSLARTVPNGFGQGAFDGNNRKPVAVLFRANSSNGLFTAVINHFKSKRSSAGGLDDADSGDGQGLSNGTRVRAATDLKAWLATNPLGISDTDVLLFGDFNAYQKEAPLTVLENSTNGAYVNLSPDSSYSYVFDGSWGSLDHVLVSGTLKLQNPLAEKFHINADEPPVLDYNLNFKSATQRIDFFAPSAFRASDHDAVIVDVNLNADPIPTCTVNGVTLNLSSVNVAVGSTQQLVLTVDSTPPNCASITWNSSTGNASVSSSGLITGVSVGTSSVSATATGTGGSTASGSATVNVTASASDFSLTLGTPSPSSFTAGTGGSATASLSLTPSGGYNGTPVYTVNSTPTGVTGNVTGNTVNLTVPSSLAAGSYSVTVSGTDSSVGTRTSNAVTVTVNAVTSGNLGFGAAFTAGNVVIYRIGDGSGALSGSAFAAFLDEYTPSGTLVQSKALPTLDTGIHQTLTNSGSSNSEGQLTRSSDGKCLVFAGYDASPGTATVITASGVNRVVGVVFNGTPAVSNATLNTTTVIPDGYTGNNIRSATSNDCNNLWASGTGTGGGVRYTTLGTTSSSTLVSTTVANTRTVGIFGGQLYASSASGAFRLTTVGTGTPTTSGQTITNLSGFPTTGISSPYSFLFADLDAGVVGVDTVYLADDSSGAGIQKWSLNAGTWTLKNTVALSGARGLTGVISGSSVTLYATTQTGFFSLTDSSGYNANINGTVSLALATAGTNTIFRGIALTPNP